MHQFSNDFLCKLEAVVKCGHGAQRAKSEEVTALPPSSGQRGGAFHGQNPLALFSRLGPDQIKSNFKFQNRSLLDVG